MFGAAFAQPVGVAPYGSQDEDPLSPVIVKPTGLTDAKGTLVFAMGDEMHGYELWRVSAAGRTELVKDIRPGDKGSFPSNFANAGGIAYFRASDGLSGFELWRSDGTASGTRQVVDVNPGKADSTPTWLTAVGDVLYFVANDGRHGFQLWRTEGSAESTRMVVDLQGGPDGALPTQLTAVGDKLFFTAFDSTRGRELFVTEGTAASTRMVRDIRPGPADSNPASLVAVGSQLFFVASDGIHGLELWKSDGSEAGTGLVKDIREGQDGSRPQELTRYGDALVFAANDGRNGFELWRTDGTPSGTVMVKDINAGGPSSTPHAFAVLGGSLLFAAFDTEHGVELWKSDGTAVGTSLMNDLRVGTSSSRPQFLTAIGDAVFFAADDGMHGIELWRTDGTPNGTTLVRDIQAGAGDSFPLLFTASAGRVFFVAEASPREARVWTIAPEGRAVLVPGAPESDSMAADSVGGSAITNDSAATVLSATISTNTPIGMIQRREDTMIRHTLTAAVFAAGFALSGVALAAENCCTPTTGNSPKVGGNLGNQNYTSLTGFSKANINQLGGAWHVNLEGGSTAQSQQSSVIAQDGVLYVETTQGKLYAVDGATGVLKWTYNSFGTQQRRGAAIGQGLVFTNTVGHKVVALNKDTGEVVWSKTVDTVYGGVGKVATIYSDGMLYVGTSDGTVGSGIAMNASTGDIVWSFQGAAPPGYPGNETWGGAQLNGATPWMHPAVDPELNTVYWTFGNARAGSSQDGSSRPGNNLYANSLVALDAKTGAYKWHFQSVHHDIWDMDGVRAPLLADITVRGQPRKAVVYGSKTGMLYILDRVDGTPIVGIDEKPVPVDPRQNSSPTQPFARGGGYVPLCPTSSGPTQAVPNYPSGCLFTPHWDDAVQTYPGHGGGADWNDMSYSPRTKLVYTGYGNIGAAHGRKESSNGFRPVGERTTGGIAAIDPTTNSIVWKRDLPFSVAHGNGALTTATDLLFIGQPDGNLLGLDAMNGRELWRFQAGAGVNTNPVIYTANGQQYMAVLAGGNGLPYADAPLGDNLWAFKIGGTVAQATTPTPPSSRRPVTSAAVEGSLVNNVVNLNRVYANGAVGTAESDGGTNGNGMAPQFMRVPVGTTVTFLNPSTNALQHCATQFFEGLFNIGPLQPGQSAQYTFKTAGEFFYNDCTSPKATGKIVVY